jgi:hypothetical protein
MSYENPRIKDLSLTIKDIVILLSDNNPGALTAMIELVKNAETVDPDSALGGLGPLLSLDTLDCYGSDIWRFYKDVCDHDAHKMLGVMRANQLGFTSDDDIRRAIQGDRTAIDIPALLSQVKARLPNFQTEAA